MWKFNLEPKYMGTFNIVNLCFQASIWHPFAETYTTLHILTSHLLGLTPLLNDTKRGIHFTSWAKCINQYPIFCSVLTLWSHKTNCQAKVQSKSSQSQSPRLNWRRYYHLAYKAFIAKMNVNSVSKTCKFGFLPHKTFSWKW